MGLKKTCRKLMKLGKKAARKGSGERVEALLQNAIVALRAELEKRGAAKKEGPKPKKEPARAPAKAKKARPPEASLRTVPS